jgi:SAM-dependent methyltransferase
MTEKTVMVYSKNYTDFILSMLDTPILNLGCGGWKVNGTNVDYNRAVNPDVVWDLNKFPYPFSNNSFGSIVMLDTLEHLDDPDHAIMECKRIASKVIIAVPSSGSKFYADAGDEGVHKTLFNRYALEKMGFEVIGYKGNSSNIPSWLGRLLGMFIGNEWIGIWEWKPIPFYGCGMR